MFLGYKYYIWNASKEWKLFSIDHDTNTFKNTMGYVDICEETQDSFIKNHCSQHGIPELHEVYVKFVRKDHLTIGIGSGYGEHELLLYNEGYPVAASDIIPGLVQQTSRIFPGFHGYTLDIFTDDLRKIQLIQDSPYPRFDVLITGMDSYFDHDTAVRLFQKVSENINTGSFLIFTLRYPDSLSRRLVEYWLYLEAVINHRIFRKGIIQKRHGYRRSVKEICSMADSAGFTLEAVQPAMHGCECSRSRILNIFYPICKKIDHIMPLFNCAFVLKFRKNS